MRASTPLAARQEQAIETGALRWQRQQCRVRQPSSPSSPAIELASARRRRSLSASSAVPSAKATSSSTTTATSSTASIEASTSSSSHASSSPEHNAAADSTLNSGPITLDQLPRPLRDSVVVLSAPNPRAAGGQTPVYVLGVSHVSKTSLDRVRMTMFFLTSTTMTLARSPALS